MSINITNKKDCCGCTACEAICAHKAIVMEPDALGFLYPKVDAKKCTECGLCEKVCAFNEHYDTSLNFSQPEVYAAKHKDPNEVANSQSGAAFVAISDWILEQGGVVYGVGYGDHFVAIHKRAVTKKERDEFRGSKYVQSDLNTVFSQVKTDLREGRMVLFSGTPCQVAGLSSFIGSKLRENLYLMDIVCHGVPGPKMWQDYLNYLEQKEKKQITAANFRDKKRFGWHSHVETFEYDNTYTYTYTYTFYAHINLRLSCGVCPFTNLRRPSDITVADFWGIEKTEAAHLGEDNKGCSMFLINTDKGKKLFGEICNNLIYQNVELREEWLQPQLKYPSRLHPKRLAFEKDYEEEGFYKTMCKHGYLGWKADMQNTLKRITPMWLKRTIKKMIKR